jgi:hypothetical protein
MIAAKTEVRNTRIAHLPIRLMPSNNSDGLP